MLDRIEIHPPRLGPDTVDETLEIGVGAPDDNVACKTGGNHNIPVEEQLVETAFSYLKKMSALLKEKFNF